MCNAKIGFSRFGGELTMAYLSLDESPLDLFVYNALGQIVAEKAINPPAIGVKEVKMDVSGYATGVYYFSLHSGNEKVSKAMLIP